MGRTCSICAHAQRDSIDAALASGAQFAAVAREYGVGSDALRRHHAAHLSPALAAMEAAREEAQAADLVARIEGLISRAEVMFSAAAEGGQAKQALDTIRELRQLLELWGKATGQLDERPTVTLNLHQAPEWLAIRDAILSALLAYPEARAAVSGRLIELEAGS